MVPFNYLLLASFLALLSQGVGDTAQRDTLYKKIYRTINLRDYCVRLTNATHAIGCGTSESGTTGTIHFVNDDDDDDVQYVSSSGKHPPYAVVIQLNAFNSGLIRRFVNSSARIAGVLINGTLQQPSEGNQSPALECPNQQFGLYSDTKCSPVWNEHASGLSYESFPFPIYILNAEDMEDIYDCYKKFNVPVKDDTITYPLCKVNMQSFMYAAGDTTTCMRRSNGLFGAVFCDPLENPQVWGSLFPLVQQEGDSSVSREIVFLAAKMDTSAFFHQMAYGAENDATGIVVLFAALEAIGEQKRKNRLKQEAMKPIVFTFFNGEEWDYIGSSRMVYDMVKGKFPDIENGPADFNLMDIKYFLELRQLGLSSGGMFYGHQPNDTRSPQDTSNTLFNTLQENAVKSDWVLEEVKETSSSQLPPASLQSFLKASTNIAGLVLTDHHEQFANKFYGSIFDSEYYVYPNCTNLPLTRNLTNVASAVARTALRLAGVDDGIIENVTAKEDTIKQLLCCFLHNSNCTYFQDLLATDDQRDKLTTNVPLVRYVSVDGSTPFVESIIKLLAVRFSGRLASGYEHTKCPSDGTDLRKWYTMQNADNHSRIQCHEAYVYEYTVKSPAFVDGNYDKEKNQYSTWAESVWDTPTVVMYVVSDDQLEDVTLGVGCMVLVVWFALVFFVTRRIEKVFIEQ